MKFLQQHKGLGIALLLGGLLRLALWNRLPRMGMISDEAEYLAAAAWLAEGRGFTWYQDWLWTRAPLYPLFIASHLRLFGLNLIPIYLSQTLLSLGNIGLIYALGRRFFPSPQIACLGGIFAAIYLPFATYPQMLLSETFYLTLLLIAFLSLAHWQAKKQTWQWGIFAGIFFGLATLTRSLTLGFLPFVVGWLWHVTANSPEDLNKPSLLSPFKLLPLIFLATCILTILPWSCYASRLYGGTIIVDTTGAYNLLLGAQAAVEGEGKPPQITASSQGQRQSILTWEGLQLIQQHPLAFLHKGLKEFVALLQINYTGAERLTNGFTTGRLPRWYILLLFLLDDTLYALLLPLAILGWARSKKFFFSLLDLWGIYHLLTVPLLFAINRFRFPLLPFACLYAAASLDQKAPKGREVYALPFAIAVALVILTPYAYLQTPPATWASYLGPYPSSLTATLMAWQARPAYLQEQKVKETLGAGNLAKTKQLLAEGLPNHTFQLAYPLLKGLEGQAEQGLSFLTDPQKTSLLQDWQVAVLKGDLLRRLGDLKGAKAAFTPSYVDDENPVNWAWQWLNPPPTRHIDLGGNLDLGYIQNFYLGEGDSSAKGTFRWSAPTGFVRFPQQGQQNSQKVCLRADGRGYPTDLPKPQLSLFLLSKHEQPDLFLNSFDLQREVQTYCTSLPPTTPKTEILLKIETKGFIPDAHDLLAQRGKKEGQLRILGVRLDWIDLQNQ